MRKNSLIQVCCLVFLMILVIGCEKDEATVLTRIEIDNDNSSIEGSFVQNVTLNSVNVFNLSYKGGAPSASISAKEVNGVYITKKDVSLTKDGLLKLQIEGKPIDLGEYTLKVELTIGEKKYYCSQLFNVAEDTDPSAPILFTMEAKYNNIVGLTEPIDIPFTVDPNMASVTVATPVAGLNVKAVVDKKTGQGTLTLTPSNELISGALELLITFGARTPINHTINVAAFDKGDGTVANPYEISSVVLFKKVQYLLDKNFKLTENIDLANAASQPIGSITAPFTGSLDGNGKTISNINITGTENVGLFGATSSAAKISGLTISGSATGTDNVGGLVGANAGTITGCNAANMNVTGDTNLSAIAGKNTGTVSSSSPADVLTFTNFPSVISELTVAKVVSLNYSPATAVTTIVTNPNKITASISGANLNLSTPEADFLNSEMTIKVTLGKVSSTIKTIKLFREEQFDSGDGSVANPFVIVNERQFSKMRDFADKNFKVAADIDLSLLSSPWTPIAAFSGTLDGGNHKVKVCGSDALTVTLKGGIIVANTGNIKNIAFTDVNITTAVPFGVIVGDHSVGTIENVVVKGTVTSTNTGDLLGGIAAELTSGKISNIYVNLSMDATCGMIGGIVGRAKTSASEISNCTTEGSITIKAGKNRIAGIVGRGETAVVIKNCLSSMTITAAVAGANGVGGIFGANNNDNMRIDECMFTGKISNAFSCGGIAGVGANIRNCVVEGSGIATTMITVGGGAINTASTGAIVGTGKGTIENCIARSLALGGTSTAPLPISGISSTFQNNGFVSKCVVNNVTFNATTAMHGIAGTAGNGTGVNTNNYTSGVTYTGYTPVDNANGVDGAEKTAADLTQAFYQSLGYDFTTIWNWTGGKPVLKNVGYKGSISPASMNLMRKK